MRKMAVTRVCAVAFCALLGACASTGTRVTSDGGAYKSMADGQQWLCTTVGGCGCSIDGKRASCALVQACQGAGNCKSAR